MVYFILFNNIFLTVLVMMQLHFGFLPMHLIDQKSRKWKYHFQECKYFRAIMHLNLSNLKLESYLIVGWHLKKKKKIHTNIKIK